MHQGLSLVVHKNLYMQSSTVKRIQNCMKNPEFSKKYNKLLTRQKKNKRLFPWHIPLGSTSRTFANLLWFWQQKIFQTREHFNRLPFYQHVTYTIVLMNKMNTEGKHLLHTGWLLRRTHTHTKTGHLTYQMTNLG